MKDVTVNKDVLLNRVKQNRIDHRAAFETAMAGYEKELRRILEAKLKDIRQGKRIDQYISLPVPEDHTSDYDQVILMLEMEVSDQVTIDYNTFRRYVMDEWAWKQDFTTTNAYYSQSS